MSSDRSSEVVGVLLEELTWPEAEKALSGDAVVVIPLGAAAKEHGPHLKLKNDWLIAEYLKRRVIERLPVVVAPTVAYHFYPAFTEYPGSITLSLETATAMIVEMVSCLSKFGPKRFYVINTGISTVRALLPAAAALASNGIVLEYTRLDQILEPIENGLLSQDGGTHADEGETSMMLYIAPGSVDMSKAERDFNPHAPGGLTRSPESPGTYSPSGIWGDATLATRAKGERLVEALVEGILYDIERLGGAGFV